MTSSRKPRRAVNGRRATDEEAIDLFSEMCKYAVCLPVGLVRGKLAQMALVALRYL